MSEGPYIAFNLPPAAQTFTLGGGTPNEIRISSDGIWYRGETIDDAGQVQRAMLAALSGRIPTDALALACGRAGVSHAAFLKIRAYLPAALEYAAIDGDQMDAAQVRALAPGKSA